MSGRRKAQLRIPATAKPVRQARNEWRAALAALEEAERDADEKAELAREAKELVAELARQLRVAQLVLREAEDAADGRQEGGLVDGAP